MYLSEVSVYTMITITLLFHFTNRESLWKNLRLTTFTSLPFLQLLVSTRSYFCNLVSLVTHRTTESNILIGYITLVTLYNQLRQMGSQNSCYLFWSNLLNAMILILMKRPIITLCLIMIRYCRNHNISSEYYDECYFLYILLDLY